MTIGADSALHRITEAIDNIVTTASRYAELNVVLFLCIITLQLMSVVIKDVITWLRDGEDVQPVESLLPQFP